MRASNWQIARAAWLIALSLAALAPTSAPALAVDPSDPLGKWMTIDDVSGKPRSVVEISIVNGVAEGTVVKLFPKPGDTGLCGHCTGELAGKPIVGLRILSGVKKDGDQWDGGHIFDPGEGQSYDVRLRVLDGGQRLEVRGFLGFSLLGRTQIWVRAS